MSQYSDWLGARRSDDRYSIYTNTTAQSSFGHDSEPFLSISHSQVLFP